MQCSKVDCHWEHYSQCEDTIIENTDVDVQSTVFEKNKRLVYMISS